MGLKSAKRRVGGDQMLYTYHEELLDISLLVAGCITLHEEVKAVFCSVKKVVLVRGNIDGKDSYFRTSVLRHAPLEAQGAIHRG